MSNIASLSGFAPSEPPKERTRYFPFGIPSSFLEISLRALRSSPRTGSPVTTTSFLGSRCFLASSTVSITLSTSFARVLFVMPG